MNLYEIVFSNNAVEAEYGESEHDVRQFCEMVFGFHGDIVSIKQL